MVPTHHYKASMSEGMSSKAMADSKTLGGLRESAVRDTLMSRSHQTYLTSESYLPERSDPTERRYPLDETATENVPIIVRERQDSMGSGECSDDSLGIVPVVRRKKLTLSAFRRPEQTVRLTHADGRRRFDETYDMHALGCRVLGHGAYSTVRLAVRRRDGVKVAVKSIAKHEALRARRLRKGNHRGYLEEWEILRRMKNHPYIISLLDVFETDEEVQLVMEFCPGGELFDAIQKRKTGIHTMRRGQYTEQQAARIVKQVLSALADLHDLGIVHRDVKPENILLMDDEDDGRIHVKLCDFGVARSIMTDNSRVGRGDKSPPTPGRTRAYSMIGSNFYVAPEINRGSAYDVSVDIYSLGVTLYILLCGFRPVFSGSDDNRVIFPQSYWKDISEDAKDLILKMLHPDTETRLTAREASSHPWIREYATPVASRRTSFAGEYRERVDTNLYVVRHRLKSVGSNSDRKRRSLGGSEPYPKRTRMERRTSSCLMALADLYRGVASPARTSRDRQRDPKGMRVNMPAISF